MIKPIRLLSLTLLAVIFLLTAPIVGAAIPPWFDTVGGANAEGGFAIATSPTGLIVSVGITNTTCDGRGDITDGIITIYNTNGTLLQVYLLDNTSIDNLTAITYHSGKFYIAGSSIDLYTVSSYFTVISLDANTKTIDWVKYYEKSGYLITAHGIAATDNYIYVAGEVYDPVADDRNILLLRLYHNGTYAGSLMFGDSSINETAWNIVADSEDNIYIVGFTIEGSSPAEKDVFVAKLDADGNPVWFTRLNLTIADYGYDITFCNGKLVIVGETREDIYGNDILVVALDPDTGSVEWVKRVNYARYDEGFGITSMNGYCYIAGGGFYTYPHIEEYDIFIAQLDDSGNLVSFWKLDGGALDVAIDIASLDNYLYLTGVTNSSGEGSFDMFTMKFGGEGQYRWIGGEGWTPVNSENVTTATSTDATYELVLYRPPEAPGSITEYPYDLTPYIDTFDGFGWHVALYHPPPVGGELYITSNGTTLGTIALLGVVSIVLLGGILFSYRKH